MWQGCINMYGIKLSNLSKWNVKVIRQGDSHSKKQTPYRTELRNVQNIPHVMPVISKTEKTITVTSYKSTQRESIKSTLTTKIRKYHETIMVIIFLK